MKHWRPVVVVGCHVTKQKSHVFSRHDISVPGLAARVALEHGMDLRARAKRSFFGVVQTTLKAIGTYFRRKVFVYHHHDYVASCELGNLA
jgi:hypothetical protein